MLMRCKIAQIAQIACMHAFIQPCMHASIHLHAYFTGVKEERRKREREREMEKEGEIGTAKSDR